MRSIKLRFADFADKKAVHDYLSSQLGFPDYYGANLDAMYDVLSTWPEDIRIYTECSGTSFEAGFCQVLRDLQKENRRITVREVKAGGSRRKRTRQH